MNRPWPYFDVTTGPEDRDLQEQGEAQFIRVVESADDDRTCLTSVARVYSMHLLRRLVSAAGLICIAGMVFPEKQAYSQENTGPTPGEAPITRAISEADLLKETQNPVADLISVPIQNMTNFGIGPYNRTDNVVSLQPVVPLKLSDDWLLVSRIIQPIAWQPEQDQRSDSEFGLGDLNPTFFLVPRQSDPLIWGVGPAMVIPTATNNTLGQGKLSLGPSAVDFSTSSYANVGKPDGAPDWQLNLQVTLLFPN